MFKHSAILYDVKAVGLSRDQIESVFFSTDETPNAFTESKYREMLYRESTSVVTTSQASVVTELKAQLEEQHDQILDLCELLKKHQGIIEHLCTTVIGLDEQLKNQQWEFMSQCFLGDMPVQVLPLHKDYDYCPLDVFVMVNKILTLYEDRLIIIRQMTTPPMIQVTDRVEGFHSFKIRFFQTKYGRTVVEIDRKLFDGEGDQWYTAWSTFLFDHVESVVDMVGIEDYTDIGLQPPEYCTQPRRHPCGFWSQQEPVEMTEVEPNADVEVISSFIQGVVTCDNLNMNLNLVDEDDNHGRTTWASVNVPMMTNNQKMAFLSHRRRIHEQEMVRRNNARHGILNSTQVLRNMS
jgi:hypothetical protein